MWTECIEFSSQKGQSGMSSPRACGCIQSFPIGQTDALPDGRRLDMGCTVGGSQNYSLVTVVNVTVSQTRQLDRVPRAKQVLTRQHMVSLPEGRKLQGMEIHPALCAWKSFVCSADE